MRTWCLGESVGLEGHRGTSREGTAGSQVIGLSER